MFFHFCFFWCFYICFFNKIFLTFQSLPTNHLPSTLLPANQPPSINNHSQHLTPTTTIHQQPFTAPHINHHQGKTPTAEPLECKEANNPTVHKRCEHCDRVFVKLLEWEGGWDGSLFVSLYGSLFVPCFVSCFVVWFVVCSLFCVLFCCMVRCLFIVLCIFLLYGSLFVLCFVYSFVLCFLYCFVLCFLFCFVHLLVCCFVHNG